MVNSPNRKRLFVRGEHRYGRFLFHPQFRQRGQLRQQRRRTNVSSAVQLSPRSGFSPPVFDLLLEPFPYVQKPQRFMLKLTNDQKQHLAK